MARGPLSKLNFGVKGVFVACPFVAVLIFEIFLGMGPWNMGARTPRFDPSEVKNPGCTTVGPKPIVPKYLGKLVLCTASSLTISGSGL